MHSELSVSLNLNVNPRLLCESDIGAVVHIVMVCDRNDVWIVRNAVGKAGELQRFLAVANIDFGIQNVFQSKDFNLVAEITFAGESTQELITHFYYPFLDFSHFWAIEPPLYDNILSWTGQHLFCVFFTKLFYVHNDG